MQKPKHLGIVIGSDLRWKDHLTSALSSVAPHVTLCLRLAYRHRLPAAVIRKFYVTFIRPRLEYCSAVWCGASSTLLKRLEKLQLRVARAMVNQASGGSHRSSLLQQVDLPTLAWRRREHCLLLLWKLLHGQGPPQLASSLPLPASSRSARTLRSGHAMEFPSSQHSLRLTSFLCFVIPIWNVLPASVVSGSRVASFRTALQEFFSADKFSFGLWFRLCSILCVLDFLCPAGVL